MRADTRQPREPNGPDDAEVLSEIARGELDRFDAFVDRYKGRLFAFIRQRVGDAHRAEDLTQDVFLRAFRAARRGGYDGRPNAGAWLFSIAHNCVTDYLRLLARRPVVVDAGAGDVPARSTEPARRDPLRSTVYAMLAHLPPEQREVVVLKAVGGLTFAEIAAVVGCPVPTAKSRMRYGLEKLRALLSEGGKPNG